MVNKIFQYTMLILVILAPVFACLPLYEENVNIQVLDNSLRPIQNASIIITYQLASSVGKGYSTTNPKYTNSSGMSYFIFRNQEFVNTSVDCNYVVNASYDGKSIAKTVNVDGHPNPYTINMDVYRINVKVYDQDGNALPDSAVWIRDMKKITDENGFASFSVSKGFANITIRRDNGVSIKQTDILGDMQFNFQVPVYDFELNVLDDYGQPLQASVNVDGSVYSTDSEGKLILKKIFDATPKVKTVYGGSEKSISADLAVQKDWFAIYDLHSPVVDQFKLENDNGLTNFYMRASDDGMRSSGIAQNGLSFKYAVNGVQYDGDVKSRGSNQYYVQMPYVKKSGVVEFEIDANDNEGNMRFIKGYFSVSYPSSSDSPQNNQQNSILQLDPVFVIGIAFFVVLALGAVFYLKSKFMGEGNQQ